MHDPAFWRAWLEGARSVTRLASRPEQSAQIGQERGRPGAARSAQERPGPLLPVRRGWLDVVRPDRAFRQFRYPTPPVCVDAQKAAGFPVAAACQAAEVTRSAYYAWRTQRRQGPSDRHPEEARLVGEIRRIHARSKATYGAPRVGAELRRRGFKVNHCDDLDGGHGKGLTQSTTGLVPVA